MSLYENLGGNTEITPTQRQNFIDNIEELRPLLDREAGFSKGQESLEYVNVIEGDEETPNVGWNIYRARFKLPEGLIATVDIVEDKIVFKDSSLEDESNESIETNWILEVPQSPLMPATEKIMTLTIDSYKVTETVINGIKSYSEEHTERILVKQPGQKNWSNLNTSSITLKWRQIKEKEDAGELSEEEATRLKFNEFEKYDKFLKKMGLPGDTFTQKNYFDTLYIFEKISPSNKI